MPLIETKGAASSQGFGEFTVTTPPVVNYIEDVFSTYLYTGNSSTQTITNGIDLSTNGGLVWGKSRSAAFNNNLYDTARGASQRLASNLTTSQLNTSPAFSSFNSDGFSLDGASDLNFTGSNMVSWTFRKQPKFFDIVTYTGNGLGSQAVAHSLGSSPGFIICKATSATDNWAVYHRGNGSTEYTTLSLNQTNAAGFAGSLGTVNASTFNAAFILDASGTAANASGVTYVAYLFASNAGGFGLTGSDNVISCGSYAGSNNPSYPTPGAGVTVTLGYEPQFVMIKNITTGSQNWVIMDNMRQFDLSAYGWLFPNTAGAEQTGTTDVYVSPTATGFRTYGNNSTVDGGSTSETFIYIAIRRGPMKVPTLGTTVFKTVSRAGTNAAATTTGLGFPPDLVISKNSTTTYVPAFFDRLRGPLLALRSSGTNAESSASLSLMSYNQDGLSLEADASLAAINFSGTYANWNFRRAPGFFDEVCYTGTGGSFTTFNHNLAAVPELLIIKCRNSTTDGDASIPAGWWTAVKGSGTNGYWFLAGSGGGLSSPNASSYTDTWSSYFSSTTTFMPWSVTLSSGTQGQSGDVSGKTYVAYLFASCPGVSKVGSYSGNTGNIVTVNCGFTAGARFVLIKRTDSTGDWYVYDSVRGITSGNDPYLLLNLTDAEVTGTNYVDTDTTGFKVTAAAPAALNASGGTYIFLAIA